MIAAVTGWPPAAFSGAPAAFSGTPATIGGGPAAILAARQLISRCSHTPEERGIAEAYNKTEGWRSESERKD